MSDTPSTEGRTPYELVHGRDALAHIGQVKNKIKHGTYTLEDMPCFCGADRDQDLEVTQVDRYGMPHRMVICQACALIRANPRMTRESYKAFYNDEYRGIHMVFREAGFSPIPNAEEYQRALYNLQQKKGTELIDFCYREMVDLPETVIDFACHYGGQLSVLKEQGVKNLYGIEIDHKARAVANDMGLETYSTLDELIAKGVKADLLIMQDIIEHLNGFDDLAKVAQLMAKDGQLYVWTPGLFSDAKSSSPDVLFQLAHTYQFCAVTLSYVMHNLGFQPLYFNEEIVSLWKYGLDPDIKMPDKPAEWVEHQMDQLTKQELRKTPPFRGTCKFSKRERISNLAVNYKRGIPDLHAITGKYSGAVMIVAGGSSVDGQIPVMKEMHEKGMPVICISRMYPWCIKHGLGPDFVVGMDSMERQIEAFEIINPGTLHLLCSSVHPKMFDKVPKDKTYIWDNADEPLIREQRQAAGYTACTVIGAGGTVTVSAMSIAINLGFDDLRMFGSDCMYGENKKTHADDIACKNVKMYMEEVIIDGKSYLTSPTLLIFTRNILDMIWAAHTQGLLKNIKFYGENLIDKMWDGKFLTEEEVAEMTGYKAGEKMPDRIIGSTLQKGD